MKKFINSILLVATAVLCLLGNFGCGHTHTFGGWSTQSQPTCIEKGIEVRSCECGEIEQRDIEINPNAHTFGNWTVTTQPTCIAKGEETRSCACGEVQTRDIAINSNAHSFGNWTEATAPTCTTKGKENRTCACGEVEERDIEINPNAHSFGDWSVESQSTCTVKGKEVRSCKCGAKESRDIALNPNAHVFSEWTVDVPATCSSKGKEIKTCACGEKEERELPIDPNNHTAGEVDHDVYYMKNSRTGENTSFTTKVTLIKWADRFTVQYDCVNSKMFSATEGYNTALYNGDICEIFITVGNDTSTYYEIEVAPNNSVFFMKIKNNNGSLQSTPQVNTLTTEVIKNTDGYTVKMTIPYASVEYDLTTGAYFNAYRIETEGGETNKHLLAVSPTMNGSFHTPSSFIKI